MPPPHLDCSMVIYQYLNKSLIYQYLYIHNCLHTLIIYQCKPNPNGPVSRAYFSCWRPGRLCHVTQMGLAATEPLQFSSGQTARLTRQKRPGRFSSRLAVEKFPSSGCWSLRPHRLKKLLVWHSLAAWPQRFQVRTGVSPAASMRLDRSCDKSQCFT